MVAPLAMQIGGGRPEFCNSEIQHARVGENYREIISEGERI